MRNLLSREEYIEQLNEGFIKDTIKKGVQKVKSAFNFFVKKIKNMILIFDKNGKILPVVTPQSTMNMVADIKSVKMYAPQDVIDRTVKLGGVGCETTAPLKEDDEIYNYGPDGKEFAEWIESGEYKNDIEYQNFMRIPKIVNEFYENLGDEDKKLFETMMNENWDDVKQQRVSYKKDKELIELPTISTQEFRDEIEEIINDWSVNRGKTQRDPESGKEWRARRNFLVFGAPGIGKSTIPNLVVEEWNKGKKPSDMISLLIVDCPNLQPGDLMMPTMPSTKKIPSLNNIDKETYPVSFEILSKMSDAEREKMETELDDTKQWVSDVAPKVWLPAYRPTGDKLYNAMLDEKANKGVFIDEDGYATKTTGGGIILFDEFLRTKPQVFDELLILFLERQLFGYRLGSRWAIIACSNRPVDDINVEKVFGEWQGNPASKDRYERMFILDPDPEGWKKWIRKKGCDELILKFIFDKNSMSGDEYPRWHSAVVNGTTGSQVRAVTPREWQSVIEAINRKEVSKRKKGKIPDVSQLDTRDIRSAMKGSFDNSFIDEFIDWLDIHKNTVDVKEILEDPINTPLTKAMLGRDEANMTTCLDNIWDQLNEEFKDKPQNFTDEKLTNLYIWLGRNFRNSANEVETSITNRMHVLLEDNSENSFYNHRNACIVVESAWPPSDLIKNDIPYFVKKGWFSDEKKALKVFKDTIKKYFPWNLENDEIVPYDDLKTD